jgi:acyl-CoA-binding protein
VSNWKAYTGHRKPKIAVKLQAVYKQATSGDCDTPSPDNRDTDGKPQTKLEREREGMRWTAWKQLIGMDVNMAKRRFITLLSEIDPLLIEVTLDENPPIGFPLDSDGHLICARCNTTTGCSRPLLDKQNRSLKQHLFGSEELFSDMIDSESLREWVRDSQQQQKCVWGSHQPITNKQVRVRG